jgi:hypothetical protein
VRDLFGRPEIYSEVYSEIYLAAEIYSEVYSEIYLASRDLLSPRDRSLRDLFGLQRSTEIYLRDLFTVQRSIGASRDLQRSI